MKEGSLGRAPGTVLLGLLWCLIFGWMAYLRGFRGLSLSELVYGSYMPTSLTHLFGDVTPRELYAFQFWRALTATFVHFNLLHLALNLVGFLQLGRLIESWYGTWIFLMIYVLIGVTANLAANLARPFLSPGDPTGFVMHSGGGSTVVLGLVGLVAVVGWRNPSEFPRRVRWWLIALLIFNGGLGLLIPRIDNLGHLAGVLAGGTIGLLDTTWIGWHERRRRFLPGLLAIGAIVASLGMMKSHQDRENAAANRLLRAVVTREALGSLLGVYQKLAGRDQWIREMMMARGPSQYVLPPLVLKERTDQERRLKQELRDQLMGFRNAYPTEGETLPARAARTVVQVGARALVKVPTVREQLTFMNSMQALLNQNGLEVAERKKEYDALNSPQPRFGSRWIRVKPRGQG